MEKKEYRQLLSQRQYIRLLLADTINRFGDSMDVIAYSWIMYEITGSASLMALVVGLNFVPTVFLTPFAGAFVDRISKKRVMALADLLHIPREATVAVGDSENDRAMLEKAGIAAVMANGMPHIQALADLVSTNDCDHDGVAELFERLGL